MLNKKIERLMAEIATIRREHREERDRQKRMRLLVARERLWDKAYAVDVAKGRPVDALLQEVNALYERKVGDRGREAVVAVQLRLLWCAIEKRRRCKAG
jgi:hypothetical protein